MSLPGHRHPLAKGATCDCHPDRAAIACVQGETDSFGYETIDMCQECLDAHRAYTRSAEASTGKCDWCSNEATDLAYRRDYDEGMGGPVYHICGTCRARQVRDIAEELDRYDAEYGGWD